MTDLAADIVTMKGCHGRDSRRPANRNRFKSQKLRPISCRIRMTKQPSVTFTKYLGRQVAVRGAMTSPILWLYICWERFKHCHLELCPETPFPLLRAFHLVSHISFIDGIYWRLDLQHQDG